MGPAPVPEPGQQARARPDQEGGQPRRRTSRCSAALGHSLAWECGFWRPCWHRGCQPRGSCYCSHSGMLASPSGWDLRETGSAYKLRASCRPLCSSAAPPLRLPRQRLSSGPGSGLLLQCVCVCVCVMVKVGWRYYCSVCVCVCVCVCDDER